jgi:hypothetical protein
VLACYYQQNSTTEMTYKPVTCTADPDGEVRRPFQDTAAFTLDPSGFESSPGGFTTVEVCLLPTVVEWSYHFRRVCETSHDMAIDEK